jgi:trimeric autotransporter adhesin
MKYNFTKSFLRIFLITSLFVILAIQSQSQIISTIAGNGNGGYNGDDIPATSAELAHPYGVALDKSGNIYIADQNNNRIRKVSNGTITTVAGGAYGFSGDGGPATLAELAGAYSVATDDTGNIYIADAGNNRIRKVSALTGIISTVAGGGTSGTGNGGPATASELFDPRGVAVDDSGNIYIADYGIDCICKVSASTGIINIVTFHTNSVSPIQLNNPSGVAIDHSYNLYIADTYNNGICEILASSDTIIPIAGYHGEGNSGDGGTAINAWLNRPEDIAIDDSDNIYIADVVNDEIRKITKSTGIINTIAGYFNNGNGGYNGDGIPATSAQLNSPMGVALDDSGNVYIADTDNDRVRKVTANTTGINIVSSNKNILIYPIPNSGQMFVKLNGNGYISMNIYDETGRTVFSQSLNEMPQNSNLNIDISNVTNGVYFLRILAQEGIINKSIIIQK